MCIGRCLQFGETVWPLAPLGEILATLVDELDHDTLDLVVGDARGVLARAGARPRYGTAKATRRCRASSCAS